MLQSVSSSPTAVIVYTSGSTGVPKGVRLSHCCIHAYLHWSWRTFPYSKSEGTCTFKTSLTFVASISELWTPLLGENPLSIVVVPKQILKDPKRLIAVLEKYKIERFSSVPSLLRSILLCLELENARRDTQLLRRIKLWLCSGEPLVPSLVRHFFTLFKSTDHILYNMYGSTELTGCITFERITCLEGEIVPIGSTVDNNVVYLMDHKLKPVPRGQIGEICCAGLNLALGYVNNRDADRFIRNPYMSDPAFSILYKTGDLGKIVDGRVFYKGRSDSQVKVRGHRVDLLEIEHALHRVNAVDKIAVLCNRPGQLHQAIVAFVTLKILNWSAADVEDELKKSFPSYFMPQVKVLKTMPLLSNGKIDRQLLLKRYEEEARINSGDKAPIDMTGIPESKHKAAKCLFETVAFILGGSLKGPINKDLGFYDLGGNSLNSIYTITKLRDQGFVIGITEFISSKTLGEIVERMRSEEVDDSITLSIDSYGQKYEAEKLKDHHREAVSQIIADSFYHKGVLHRLTNPRIERYAFEELIDLLWVHLTRTGLSFAVKSKENGQCIGAALNFDMHDEPPVVITSRLNIIFEFSKSLEIPIRDSQLPKGKGRVLHCSMMGTHKDLDAKQNIEVIHFMGEEELRLARRCGFEIVYATITSPLTQQLGIDMFGYRVLLDYQANEYVAPDGSRPFVSAPDDVRALCSIKHV